MSREVCGICWCPYDEDTGECACEPEPKAQHMTDLRQAAQQALEALEIGYDSAKAEAEQYHAAMAGYRPQRHAEMDADVQKIAAAITALRAALAEPVQEPVIRYDGLYEYAHQHALDYNDLCRVVRAAITAPPQRKPLTEVEIQAAWDSVDMRHPRGNETRIAFARAVERAHGIV